VFALIHALEFTGRFVIFTPSAYGVIDFTGPRQSTAMM
jgi:hypothetical protein